MKRLLSLFLVTLTQLTEVILHLVAVGHICKPRVCGKIGILEAEVVVAQELERSGMLVDRLVV